MFGPPVIPETPEDAGELTSSISITRAPIGGEPFIQFSYEVSMRVFTIALILHQLELKAAKRSAARETAADDETKAAKAESRHDEADQTLAPRPSAKRHTDVYTPKSLTRIKKNGDNAPDK